LAWWRLGADGAGSAPTGGDPVATTAKTADDESSPVKPGNAVDESGGAANASSGGGAAARGNQGPRGSEAASSTGSSASAPARSSKVLLPADASPSAWASSIAFFSGQKNVVALQAIAEAVPGRTREERAQLAALSVRALASLGAPAKPAFDDLLVSSDRTLRLAALNAYAVNPALYGTASERQSTLQKEAAGPDPVVRAKARALLAALR